MSARPIALSALLCVLAACQPSIREGYYACSLDSECPGGWSCIGARCFSTPRSSAD
ncbi:MAG: hypothetical protein GXP55_23215, partial [Deltaproteobacteria bacterium]|nr:hypothetical protein [Deltaproteobacteria bacterium]